MNMGEYLQSLNGDQLDAVKQLVVLEQGKRKQVEWNKLVAKVASSAPPLPKDLKESMELRHA